MKLVLACDGSSSGGGPCGVGIVLYEHETGKKLDFISKYINEGTNTYAECMAMIEAMTWFMGYMENMNEMLKVTGELIELSIISDSASVVSMVNKESKPRSNETAKWTDDILSKLDQLSTHKAIKSIEVNHVGRKYMRDADYLAASAAQDQANRKTEKAFPFLKL